MFVLVVFAPVPVLPRIEPRKSRQDFRSLGGGHVIIGLALVKIVNPRLVDRFPGEPVPGAGVRGVDVGMFVRSGDIEVLCRERGQTAPRGEREEGEEKLDSIRHGRFYTPSD